MEPRLLRHGNNAKLVFRISDPHIGASMEPRLLRHGNDVTTPTQELQVYTGFNGATSSQTWKLPGNVPVTTVVPGRLQWSHVFSDMEIANDR